MTDVIAELQDSYGKSTTPDWRIDGNGDIIQTNHITRDVWFIPHKAEDLDFIVLAHNKMPQILAVLSAADIVTHTGNPIDLGKNLRALALAVTALKGGSDDQS